MRNIAPGGLPPTNVETAATEPNLARRAATRCARKFAAKCATLAHGRHAGRTGRPLFLKRDVGQRCANGGPFPSAPGSRNPDVVPGATWPRSSRAGVQNSRVYGCAPGPTGSAFYAAGSTTTAAFVMATPVTTAAGFATTAFRHLWAPVIQQFSNLCFKVRFPPMYTP